MMAGSIASTTTNSSFADAFWGEVGFDELRLYSKQSAEFFKDIIQILDERSELELHYAKNLSKLAAKLVKAAKHVSGILDTCWKGVSSEMDKTAAVHKNLGVSLHDDVVKPLKVVLESQQKHRKSIETSVDKLCKKFNDKRAEQLKSKRKSYMLARECEKMQKSCSEDQKRTVKLKSEKQIAKSQAKRVKLEDSLVGADKNYHDACISAERQRQEVESVMSQAAIRVEALEEQRLANLKSAFGRYFRLISATGPQLTQICKENLDQSLCDKTDSRTDIQTILAKRTPSKVAHRVMVLCDFYAEEFSHTMNADRRREALERYYAMFEKDILKEQKHKEGLNHLHQIYSAPSESGSIRSNASDASKLTVREKLRDTCQMLDYLDFHLYKLQVSLAAMDPARPRTTHPLSRYMEKYKDKLGYRQTTLKLPQFLCEEHAYSPSRTYSRTMSQDYLQIDSDQHSSDNTSDTMYERVPGDESVFGEVDDPDPLGTLCKVLYDFKAQRKDELSLHAGDVIRVRQKLTKEWWEGSLNGVSGYFPASYVEEVA